MKSVCLFLSLLFIQTGFAQNKLPVIRATSKSVSINDGGFLDKNGWTLSPSARPDIFTADRTRRTKYVTFYTDIDSIRVKLKPGMRYDFVILLNGKDSCFTQIASAVPPTVKRPETAKADTIPFVLTEHNAIAVKVVVNNTDTLLVHFDLSSFDFHLTRDAVLKKTHLLANQPDAMAGKAAPNFNKLSKVTSLQIGSVTFTNPPVTTTQLTAIGMDGRMGWNVFEGKTVELDYDRNLLIVHPKLPGKPKGYTKVPMGFIRSFPLMSGSFEINGKRYTGDFAMDTGSETAVILDSGWVAKKQMPAEQLKLLKTTTLRDPRNNVFQTKVVLAPAFMLDKHPLNNVPVLILSSKINPAGFELNFLGNGVMKRFNMLFDFEHDNIYLKPNHLFTAGYKQSS